MDHELEEIETRLKAGMERRERGYLDSRDLDIQTLLQKVKELKDLIGDMNSPGLLALCHSRECEIHMLQDKVNHLRDLYLDALQQIRDLKNA